MPNPASSKFRERCQILSNEKVAPGHFVLKIASKKISLKCQPGQFVQILCEDSYEPLLPRPFSFLTATKTDFSILYHVIGKGTKALSQKKKGDELWILGPLGNGFSLPVKRTRSENLTRPGTVILVGGGVGIPPLYHLAQHLTGLGPKSRPDRVRDLHENLTGPGPVVNVFLGARDKSLLLCEKEFKKLKVNLRVATDNGSKGLKGLVTQLLEEKLCAISTDQVQTNQTRSKKPTGPRPIIYTCGPTQMLKAVSLIAQEYDVPCEVSVEVPMACGFGACLGCAITVKDDSTDKVRKSDPTWSAKRYAIACCEGPVFPGNTIVWE